MSTGTYFSNPPILSSFIENMMPLWEMSLWIIPIVCTLIFVLSAYLHIKESGQGEEVVTKERDKRTF